MGFLAPWFLAGLTALGLPVWLHLLQQHKTTPKQFASLMFFERRTQSSIKHRRLKYILLMCARLLLLLLIVLAFASPYISQLGPLTASGNRFLVIAVDNSYSMRVGDRLEQAKQQAQSVLNQRSGRQMAQVLSVNAMMHAMSQPSAENNELRTAIQSIRPSDSRSSYGEFARALRSIEQSARQPLEVHFFSDMQKTSLPPAFTDLRLGDNTTLTIHTVTDRLQPNYAVENVTAPRSVFDPKKAKIQATVAAYHSPASKRNVTLIVNGRTVASKPVEVPENGRATIEFIGLDANYGFNKGEIRIEAGDSLPGDDTFFFATERSDPRKVLFVHEPNKPRGLLYYRAALEAAAEGSYLIDAVTADQVANIDPKKYSFVVLSDVGSLSPAFEEKLREHVRAGGGAFLAAGPSAASRPKVPLFDEAVRESRYATRAGERFLVAGSMDINHPVLNAGRWENVKFYQVIRVDQGQARVLARLADETPLVMEKRIGEGRVVLFASTLDNISNDFPLHTAFVPFIEQSARYLTGAEIRHTSYTVDSHIELRAEKGAGTVEVLDPTGKRALSLDEAAKARSIALLQSGFYDVGRANGRHELVAVNADRKESDLELVPRETQDLWQATGTKPASAGTTNPEQQKQTQQLWWYVLLLAMLVALFESLLASRYLSTEKETV